MYKEYTDTLRDKISLAKKEIKQLAESAKKISDALCGIENRADTICGATLDNIIDLISEYELRNGKHPMTTKSIKQAFRPDKVRIGLLPNIDWGIGATAKQRKAEMKKQFGAAVDISSNHVAADIFAAKVQVALYGILPLDDVMTDYEGKIKCQGDSIRVRGISDYIFTLHNRFTIPISFFNTDSIDPILVENTANKIAQEIMTKHLYRWKAFAAYIKCRPEGCLEVIYGVIEKKSARKSQRHILGSLTGDGGWTPNKKLQMSAGEQYNINIKNGYLCGKCMMAISSCMCGDKS